MTSDIDSSVFTDVSDTSLAAPGPHFQPEPNPTPPPPPPEQNRIESKLDYFRSHNGISKLICLMYGAIALSLTLSGFVKSRYYNYKCDADEKRTFDDLVVSGNLPHHDYTTCEEHALGTFQNCQHQASRQESTTCPNPLLIIVTLILDGVVFGGTMVFFILPLASPNMMHNHSFIKMAMLWKHVGLGANVIASILGLTFLIWVYHQHYPCESKKDHFYACEEELYGGGIYMLWTITGGAVFNLITSVAFCHLGCALALHARHVKVPGHDVDADPVHDEDEIRTFVVDF